VACVVREAVLQSGVVTVPEALALALQNHRSGRLAEAESICRQILSVEPRHADALHMLGVIAHQVGRHDVAVEMIHRALDLAPDAPAFHCNLGVALEKLGRADEAIAAYRRAVELMPDCVDAHGNLASAFRDRGCGAEAVAAYRRVVEFKPDSAEACYNLGIALLALGKLDEASASFRGALELKPDLVEAYNGLGVALRKQGWLDGAVAEYRRAIQIKPDYAEAHGNLGAALADQGHFDEAITAYRRAVQLKPGLAETHYNLGNLFRDQGRLGEAVAAYRCALEHKPDEVVTWNNLGNVLQDLKRFDEALAAYRRALEQKPDDATTHNNLGNVFKEQGRLAEAMAAFQKALQFSPDGAMTHSNIGNVFKDQGQLDEAVTAYRRAQQLQPGGAMLHSNLIYSLHFHPEHDGRSIAAEHRVWSQRFAEPPRQFVLPHANDRSPERRLRIGYVSPDFWRHVICHFLTPLLEAHDHSDFEIWCYSSVKRPDPMTARLRKSADAWRDVLGRSDEALAQQIREDGIDILVDLTQHMADNRLRLFARKPAPVQVAWLGYPGSTGLEAMDYRLTDACMEPEGAAWSASVEEPVQLPDSWFCYDPIDEFPLPGELPALRSGRVTFGCLNNFCKVNGAVLRRWAGVMRAVEGSRLLLQCPLGETRARVQGLMEAEGVTPDRVEMVAMLPRAEFLGLFERIDIALDPFPYNGGTTTCEALWMGIPVLTLPGSVTVSRIGLSILSACGMPEFVADSDEAYVTLARELAGDLPRLAALRGTLRDRMKASRFMDGPRFARNMENACRQMWRAWCRAQGSNPVS